MTSRWKKVWADFWGNKSRTFITMITIAVGTFAVGFNSNMNLYMNESMDSDYLSTNPSEATVYAFPMDEDIVELARSMPGVELVACSSPFCEQVWLLMAVTCRQICSPCAGKRQSARA